MNLKRFLAIAVLLSVISLVAVPVPSPVGAQTMWTRFRNVLVEHNLDVGGDADIDGTLNADAVDLDGNLQLDGTLTVGTAGSGYDVTFQSGTSGDLFLWDASEEGLYITGTAGQDALDIVDGNVDIDDDVDVNGTTNLDDVDIDLSTSLNIDGHMLDVGTCTTPSTADGDDDVCIAGDLEVDDELELDGALDANGNVDIAGATTLTQVNAAGGSANPFDYTGTLGIMNGSDDFTLFDVNITNADHTSTGNTVQALDIANITGDADATESAIIIGTGWDLAIDANSGVDIDGGLTDIGGGTYTTADGDDDLGVAGDLEVDNTLDVDGAATVASTLTVEGNVSDSGGTLTLADDVLIDGQADANQLVVQGNGTQTNSLLVLEQSDGTDKLTVSNEGQVVFGPEADSDAANYDEWVTITGNMTGTGTKDRNYGLLIEMTRPAGQEIGSGDHDEAALKIRIDTEAVTTTAGTVLRGADIEAKADNPGGTVTNLHGALITAKSDTSAGDVDDMWGLSVNAQNNAAVNTTLLGADIRIMRQAATQPTTEAVLRLRSGSTTGSGADAALLIYSNGTGGSDDFDYLIDGATADVNTADIRLSNGETIANTTDTAVQIGGFLALTEGSVIDLGSGGTITPTASYQPITNATGGSIDTSATTAIADGPVAGSILIICNEDAQDVVIKDGANTDIGGDQTLTGGAGDCISLIWNGADWNKFAPQADN
jgi:hypothetical protein